MRILIPASLLFALGCRSEALVSVGYDAASFGDDALVRVAIGEETEDGFSTLVATGGPASSGMFELEAPAGENRLARVLIHDRSFEAIAHGVSAPFTLEEMRDPTEVTVELGPPPEGSITLVRIMNDKATIGMRARRWERVHIGLNPKDPFGEAVREATEPPSETLESFALEVPLDRLACTIDRGCPLTFFADFLAADGVAGRTASATVTYDPIAPSLTTRARILGGTVVGAATTLVVEVEASEPVSNVMLALEQRDLRSGDCGAMLGPFECTGTSVRYSCNVDAPAEECDASYTISVSAIDAAGNATTMAGADVAIDNVAPELMVSSIGCAAGAAVVSGMAPDAVQVVLQDDQGAALAWAEGGSFVLAGSSTITAAVAAFDAGGNETSRPVACP